MLRVNSRIDAVCVGSEKGNALVIALLVLMVLSTMAVAFVAVTKTETQISGNQLRGSQALYVAEAGVSEALARMSVQGSPSYIGENLSSPTVGWGRYVVLGNGASVGDPEFASTQSDSLDNDGDGSIDETGEVYPEVASSQVGLQEVINYPWVKVRYKLGDDSGITRVLLYGDHDNDPSTRPMENFASGFPVIIVTSNGVRSNANKTVEVEAVKIPGPPVPGSVYTEGNLDCNGTSFHIDGNDYDPALGTIVAGSTPLPGVVATGGLGAVNCNVPQGWNNIEGEGPAPSVATATFDIDLPAYVDTYGSVADLVYNGDQSNPNTTGWGTIDDYKIIHIRGGDLHLSGSNDGGGVLLVDGDLKISGQFTWYGLIVCLGDTDFTGGGSGIHIYGCVMTQGDIATSGVVTGNADLYYSSETISKLSDLSGYTVALWTER
ncbi:MAG: hypothetical protein AMJ46_04755 [Latescibacteria bacterium DG_63]|nr:MAG: hypothetical protein AMJ46_04755 [Latescibacteria bacterium DG_63]